MDPLSIAASIAGLLAASQQISSTISSILAAQRTGLKEARDVKQTVDTLRSVIQQLQLLLLNQIAIQPQHATLILVDEIVATLSACVLTFSDLDSCVKDLEVEVAMGFLSSIRYTRRAPQLRVYLRALESHKSSINLMVNILTCKSAHEAEREAHQLRIIMYQVLKSSEGLAERMSTVERSVMVRDTDTDTDTDFDFDINDGDSTLSQKTTQLRKSYSSDTGKNNSGALQNPTFVFTFEEDLHASWVYRRSKVRGPKAFSITSSTRTQSWSILSGMSLSEVSNIAVQALPIYAEDLQNSDAYWFGSMQHKDVPENRWQKNYSMNQELSYCLACDKQTYNGVYCSKVCSLAGAKSLSPRYESEERKREIKTRQLESSGTSLFPGHLGRYKWIPIYKHREFPVEYLSGNFVMDSDVSAPVLVGSAMEDDHALGDIELPESAYNNLVQRATVDTSTHNRNVPTSFMSPTAMEDDFQAILGKSWKDISRKAMNEPSTEAENTLTPIQNPSALEDDSQPILRTSLPEKSRTQFLQKALDDVLMRNDILHGVINPEMGWK